MTALKRKPRRRKEPSDVLFHALAAFVKAAGGNVVIAGPIQLMTWPMEHERNFTIAVPCMGVKPKTLETPCARHRSKP